MAGLGLGQIAAAAAMGAGAAYILTIVHPGASANIAIMTGIACTITALVSFWLMGKQQANDIGFDRSSAKDDGSGGSTGGGGGDKGKAGSSPPGASGGSSAGKHKALSGGAGARRPKAGKGR